MIEQYRERHIAKAEGRKYHPAKTIAEFKKQHNNQNTLLIPGMKETIHFTGSIGNNILLSDGNYLNEACPELLALASHFKPWMFDGKTIEFGCKPETKSKTDPVIAEALIKQFDPNKIFVIGDSNTEAQFAEILHADTFIFCGLDKKQITDGKTLPHVEQHVTGYKFIQFCEKYDIFPYLDLKVGKRRLYTLYSLLTGKENTLLSIIYTFNKFDFKMQFYVQFFCSCANLAEELVLVNLGKLKNGDFFGKNLNRIHFIQKKFFKKKTLIEAFKKCKGKYIVLNSSNIMLTRDPTDALYAELLSGSSDIILVPILPPQVSLDTGMYLKNKTPFFSANNLTKYCLSEIKKGKVILFFNKKFLKEKNINVFYNPYQAIYLSSRITFKYVPFASSWCTTKEE